MTEKDKLSAGENADKEEGTECKRIYFMKTGRFGFSKWAQDDIENHLNRDIFNEKNHQVQYWSILRSHLINCWAAAG